MKLRTIGRLSAAAAFLALSHAPASAASFDCAKARSAPEKLICGSADLSRRDEELAKLFAAAKAAAPDKQAFVREATDAWRRREATCKDAACVAAWMDERKARYAAAAAPSQTVAPPEIRQPIAASSAPKQAKLTYPYPGAPDYCYWVSAEQCERAKAIVATGKKPSWCVDGWARQDAGLSDEQRRVCWHYRSIEPTPEDDARAMVLDQWETYRSLIKALAVAGSCNVLDQVSWTTAIYTLQIKMADEAARAGLPLNKSLDLKKYTDDAVLEARGDVKNGQCDRLTPQWRGYARRIASDLLR